MLRNLLEYPVKQLADRVRQWVRCTIAEAVVHGASDGVADGLAQLEAGIAAAANVPPSLPSPQPNAEAPAPRVDPARPALPFPESLTPPATPKRGRGRPRKHLNHDSDRT